MGTDAPKIQVSTSVVRRMSKYLRHLEELENDGISRISSQMMANQLGLTASQIRQDLNSFGGFGQQGYGYSVEYLKSNIESILGVHRKCHAVLIGVGDLGRALIQHIDFGKYGVSIAYAFDIGGQTSDSRIDGVEILPIDALEQTVRSCQPQMAILAVPPEPGREIAKKLIELQVFGFWNFTNVDLHIGNPDAVVEDVHLADSLLTLRFMIGQKT